MNNRHLDSSYSFLVCRSLHLGAPGVFGLLCVSRWGTWVWVGSFHTTTTLGPPLSRDEGGLPGGLSSFQVPFFIFLSPINFLRCASESLLFCSPIIEKSVTNFSLSEEAADGLGSTTFNWGYGYVGKSAEESAPCIVSNSMCSLGSNENGRNIRSTLAELPMPM